MMATPSFAANIEHVQQTVSGNAVWADGQKGEFRLNGTDADSYLVWADSTNQGDILTVGAEGKDISLNGKNGALTGALFKAGSGSMNIVAGALNLTMDNMSASATLTGFDNVKSVKADSLAVRLGMDNSTGTKTLVKTDADHLTSDIAVKGDIDIKAKTSKLFDLAEGSEVTLKSETGSLSIIDNYSSFETEYNKGSTLNLQAEKGIKLDTTVNVGYTDRRIALLGTNGTVNLETKGDVTLKLDGTFSDQVLVGSVLVSGSQTGDGGFVSVKAKNLSLVGETEGGSYFNGLSVYPNSVGMKIDVDENVELKFAVGGVSFTNAIEVYRPLEINANRLDISVEHTTARSVDQPCGILLSGNANVVIDAEATINAKRFSETLTNTAYDMAVASTGGGAIEFKKNATLTSDYAIKAGNPGTTTTYSAKVIKSGTGDLVLNGRVYLPSTADQAGLFVSDGCGVILNGAEENFTDVIAKYDGAQGTRLVKTETLRQQEYLWEGAISSITE